MIDDDWHEVCAVDELDDEEILQFWVDDTPIAVINVAGEFYAANDQCSHQQAYLSEGSVVGDLLECPLHQGLYEVATGAARGGPACADLPVYPVAVHDGRLYVQYAEGR